MRQIGLTAPRPECAVATMDSENIVIASDAGIYIRTTDDIGELLGACFGASGVLLAQSDLAPDFFNLKSGLAGELLQKCVNYRLRAAIVLENPDAHGERFSELVREHRNHSAVRFFFSRADAEAWLAPG